MEIKLNWCAFPSNIKQFAVICINLRKKVSEPWLAHPASL